MFGIYITSYSRLSLFQVAIELLKKKNINLIYSDTDSWKVQGNLEVINNVIDRYNKYVIDNSESNRYYKIGTFDYEGTYNYFSTLGCKKYIAADKKKVYVTIAGINKHITSENLSILYKDLNYDFSLFCKNNNNQGNPVKKHKPFMEREGDWVCSKCKNLNFAFRTRCNRCHLQKSELEKRNNTKYNNNCNTNNQYN